MRRGACPCVPVHRISCPLHLDRPSGPGIRRRRLGCRRCSGLGRWGSTLGWCWSLAREFVVPRPWPLRAIAATVSTRRRPWCGSLQGWVCRSAAWGVFVYGGCSTLFLVRGSFARDPLGGGTDSPSSRYGLLGRETADASRRKDFLARTEDQAARGVDGPRRRLQKCSDSATSVARSPAAAYRGVQSQEASRACKLLKESPFWLAQGVPVPLRGWV